MSIRLWKLAIAMVVSTGLMAAAPQIAQPLEERVPTIEYEIANSRVTFFFEKLNLWDIHDIFWNGKSIHSAVISEKIGQIAYHEDGFSVAFGRRLSLKGPGVMEVVLVDGQKLQKALFTGPLPTLEWIAEKASCTDAAGKYNAVQCGSVISDVGTSPYPCCDNTDNGSWTDTGDGNCTWFAWYKAKKIKQWTVPSTWGGGGTWCTRAAATAGWKVSSVPTAGTIACGLSVGHVGWVFAVSTDKTRINLQEQNCRVSPWCVGSGVQSKYYNASSFNYISKN